MYMYMYMNHVCHVWGATSPNHVPVSPLCAFRLGGTLQALSTQALVAPQKDIQRLWTFVKYGEDLSQSNFVSTSGMHLSKSTNTTTTAACNIFCKLRRTFGLVPWHKLTQPITRLQLSQLLFQCMIRPPHVCMSLHISVYICGTGQGLWKRRKICNMFKSKTSAKNVKNTNTQCSEMQCPQQLPICSMKGQIEMIEIRKLWWNSKDAKDDRLQGFKAANPAARWIERLVKPDAWIWLVNLGSLGLLPAEALDFLLRHGKTSSKHGFHETWTWLNTSEDNCT